jgi:predicted RNA binding protein YcfA (HicA-like mRNA interferase family)
MQQFTKREFIKIIEKNGYYYSRNNGSHSIYKNDVGNHISIPKSMNICIIRRLIKENNLIVNE